MTRIRLERRDNSRYLVRSDETGAVIGELVESRGKWISFYQSSENGQAGSYMVRAGGPHDTLNEGADKVLTEWENQDAKVVYQLTGPELEELIQNIVQLERDTANGVYSLRISPRGEDGLVIQVNDGIWSPIVGEADGYGIG